MDKAAAQLMESPLAGINAAVSRPSVGAAGDASLDTPHDKLGEQSQPPDLFADLSQHKELDDYLSGPPERVSMAVEQSPTKRPPSSSLDCRTCAATTTTRPPSQAPPRLTAASRSEGKLSEEPATPTSSRDDIFTAFDAEAVALFDPFESASSSPPSSSGGAVQKTGKGDSRRQKLQKLVLSTARVKRACFVTPRAGRFEGRFVALVTAATPPPHCRKTSLVAAEDHEAGRRQVHELRTAVLEWGGDSPRPDIWIVLRSMALDGRGAPDARRLQTWVQNATGEVVERIMDMQQLRHRRGSMAEAKKETPTLPSAMACKESAAWAWPGAAADEPGKESEFFPLSLMQQLFFRTTMKRSIESAAVSGTDFRFNQSILLRVGGGGAALADIEAAIDVLACRHAMLRARFRLTGDGWAQVIAPAATRSYRFEHKYADDDDGWDDGGEEGNDDDDDSCGRGEERWRGKEVMDKKKKKERRQKHNALLAIMEQAQSSLNIFRGPVFAAQHIRTRNNRQLLYLVAHHLVVDVVSWHVLLDDLDSLLRHGTLASPSSPPSSSAFPCWAEQQRFEGSQHVVDPVLESGSSSAIAYWALHGRRNCHADTAQLAFCLTPDAASSLVAECNAVFRTESADILVASLLHSFRQTFPDRPVPTVWKQHHGRDGRRALNATVGWFTTLCPLAIAAADAETDLVQLVRLVKDTRCAVLASHQGAASAVSSSSPSALPTSRFSTASTPTSPSRLSNIPVEVMLSCVETLGQLGRPRGILEPIATPDREFDSLVSEIGPCVGRIALFEVSVVIDAAGARVEFLYNIHAARHDRIDAWLHNFEHSLLEAVGRLRVMRPQLTLADAPLLDTSYDAMTRLAASRLAAVGLDGVENIETIGPVDPVQQEMLVVQAQNPEAFHVSSTIKLVSLSRHHEQHQLIDRARLCEAWASLVAMHPALRTIFIESISERGLFDRVVLKTTPPSVLCLDSSNPLDKLNYVPAMDSSISQPRHRLSISSSSTRAYLRLDASQAICDVSSISSSLRPISRPRVTHKVQLASIHTLVSQLRRAYAGDAIHLLEGPSPRRHRHISSQDAKYRLQTWGVDPGIPPSCLFPRLALQSEGRKQTRGFDLNVSPAWVLDFCAEYSVEPAVVINLSWALVLRAFVGVDKVSFGYQSPGREKTLPPHRRQQIGSFASLVPIFLDFSNAQIAVVDMLKALQALSRESDNSESPTVAELEHALGLAEEPLFNTCVSFQDADITNRNNHGSTIWHSELVASSLNANCELSLCVTRLGNRLRGDITYHHLTADQAHNVVHTFERALLLVLNAPARPVSDVDLFTERDYEQITTPDWDPCQTDTKVSACIHQLVIEQARRRPQATAVSAWDGELSYQRLEASVANLTTHLVSLGVGPGALVPLVLDKCLWSPVAMLAVLKAGGCFVALDSQDLAAAKSIIRQLAPPLVLVTGPAWRHVSPAVKNCVLVDQSALGAQPPQLSLVPHEPIPEQAACAFLSPGKSGPKGIFFTHQSLCSILSVQGPALNICEDSRVLQLSAFNVDVAVVEIFCTFLHGGCVCIPSESDRIDGLEGVLARMNVNWSYMTPVLARRLEPVKVPSLKTICFRTRSLDQETYGPWLSSTDVLIAYGAPNVCPLAISVLQVKGPSEADVISPPLMGRFLVLHRKDPKRMVPVGATGELAIDSPLVTPHRFVPGQPLVDPGFLHGPQTLPKWRYLKTGHVARFLDRGHVRLVTSRQDEITVSGKTMLTADIERNIRRCLARGVDIAVEPITTSDSVSLLAAFLDLGRESGRKPYDLTCLDPQVKQKLLASRRAFETSRSKSVKANKELPWQCIPPVFVPVQGLPLSASLKVNRGRLRKMAASLTYAQLIGLADGLYTDFRTPPSVDKPLPLTNTEESMRLIWAGVLGTAASSIRPSDNFFDAGGDRLLVSRLVVSCRHGGFDVSVRQVLEGATLTEICRSSCSADSEDSDDAREGRKISPEAPSVGEAGSCGPHEGLIKLVLAPQLGVSRHDVLEAAEATSQQSQSIESSLYQPRGDIGCLVLDFDGPVRPQRLEAACEALTMVHPILRTGFAIHECRAYQVAVASFRVPFRHRYCPARGLDGEADTVMQQNQRLPLRLGRPVTEFTYLDGGGVSKRCKLLMRFSMAQMTEGSTAQLVRDLAQLYEDEHDVPRRASFLQFAQAAQADAQRRDSVRHWTRRLVGARMTQVVPRSRPCRPASDQAALQETVDVAWLDEVGICFDTVLKTAWAMVLARLSGSSDVVFGELVEGHRRRPWLGAQADAPQSFSSSSSMVGPLENTVPVRVRFPSESPSALHMMQLVQRECASSLAHEALGGRAIIRECTEWPGWTHFSTVVRHRAQLPGDGLATISLGQTTFTYRTVQALARTVPDLVASSTTLGPTRVALALEYPAGRVPADFASAVMDLLVGAVKTLAGFDTFSHAALPSAADFAGRPPRVLLRRSDVAAAEQEPLASRLPPQHRRALQKLLTKTWANVLCPGGVGIVEGERLEALRFYDISGTVLPAHLLAGCLNIGLARLGISGLESIHITPEEVIAYPTIPAQLGLVARKMYELNDVPRVTRRKTIVVLSQNTRGHAGSRRGRLQQCSRHRSSLSSDSVRQSPRRERFFRQGRSSVEGVAELGSASCAPEQRELDRPSAQAQEGGGGRRDKTRLFPSWSLREQSGARKRQGQGNDEMRWRVARTYSRVLKPGLVSHPPLWTPYHCLVVSLGLVSEHSALGILMTRGMRRARSPSYLVCPSGHRPHLDCKERSPGSSHVRHGMVEAEERGDHR